ncbi:Imm1 family immunity protein [Streptomyces sp. NPDC051561]|uniref:Imm1 family immunity protein n=1 Tax=Streptomyces sp. NPDC051561 TaxID=3365658 RepID=UPI003796CB9F
MKNKGTIAEFYDARGESRTLLTARDVDDMIDVMLEGKLLGFAAQLYSLERCTPAGDPDHTFHVGVDPSERTGSLMSADPREGDDHYYSVGDVTLGQAPVYYSGEEYPAFSKIPVEEIRQAVKEFVESAGMRPTCIGWETR